MADMQPSGPRMRGIPAFIKLDMTPLVDLAFLLLSFFLLTTSLRRAAGIELALGAGGPRAHGHTITLLVSGRDRIHGYAGDFDPATTLLRPYGLDQVRTALHAIPDTADFTCIIRTHPTARYEGVVRVLDEVAFLGPRHYAVQEGLSEQEAVALEPLLVAR
ncbi:MAG: biopolymer transporter ExbD [Flavobacteriales bacterium]